MNLSTQILLCQNLSQHHQEGESFTCVKQLCKVSVTSHRPEIGSSTLSKQSYKNNNTNNTEYLFVTMSCLENSCNDFLDQ